MTVLGCPNVGPGLAMEAADAAGIVSASPRLLICEDLMVVSGGTKFLAAGYKETK